MIDLTKLQPIGSHVMVELHPQKDKSDDGTIFVPESVLRPVNTGTVRTIGPHCDLPIKPGDQVFFDVTCFAIDAESERLRLLPSEGILAILEPA